VAYVRTVRTASGATAVQIVHANRRGSRDIEHIGSAHTAEDLEVLKAAARQQLHVDHDTLDFGDGRPEGEALPITSTQSKHLWDALCLAYDRLGFDGACGGDEVQGAGRWHLQQTGDTKIRHSRHAKVPCSGACSERSATRSRTRAYRVESQ
jgi:hypothetical protein